MSTGTNVRRTRSRSHVRQNISKTSRNGSKQYESIEGEKRKKNVS